MWWLVTVLIITRGFFMDFNVLCERLPLLNFK